MSPSLFIAVVDDELSVRKALGRLLTASQMGVETFASGQEFLDSLSSRRPDCVVLDLHMPGLSGLDVQRELTRTAVIVPIVIVTAHDDAERRAECLAAGASAYLLKPLDERTLLDAIGKAAGPKP